MSGFDVYAVTSMKEKNFDNSTPLVLDDALVGTLRNSIK